MPSSCQDPAHRGDAMTKASYFDGKTSGRAEWEVVESIITENFYKPDIEAIKIEIACLAAHRLSDFPPAWCMSVAPPGTLKTVILEAMNGLPDYYIIDQITPQTFISGKTDDLNTPAGRAKFVKKLKQKPLTADEAAKIAKSGKRKDSASLLHRIGNSGIISLPDFSTILGMHESRRDDLFSQMRRIYDGSLTREFGKSEDLEERSWEGRITIMAAVTPDVWHYHKMFTALGDRFLRNCWKRVGGVGAMRAATKQDRRVTEALRTSVHRLMLPYYQDGPSLMPVFPDEMLDRIGNLSELVCIARTHVHRDKDGIDCDPEPESNTRLPQGLCQIARGWTALMGETKVREEGFQMVYRTAMSCIPPARRFVLENILNGKGVYDGSMSPTGVTRAVEELQALNLVTLDAPYHLSTKAQGLIDSACGRPADVARMAVR